MKSNLNPSLITQSKIVFWPLPPAIAWVRFLIVLCGILAGPACEAATNSFVKLEFYVQYFFTGPLGELGYWSVNLNNEAISREVIFPGGGYEQYYTEHRFARLECDKDYSLNSTYSYPYLYQYRIYFVPAECYSVY